MDHSMEMGIFSQITMGILMEMAIMVLLMVILMEIWIS